MRTTAQSFDLIRRQLENNERHLRQHSTRKDLAEGNRLAKRELSLLQDQVLGYQAVLQSQEKKILKMRRIWNDDLLKICLFLCAQGYSSMDILRVIDQPIDLLIMPHEAALKNKIVVKPMDLNKYSIEENIALLDDTQKQYTMVEQQVGNDLMTTQHQLDVIITKRITQ